MHQWGGGRGGVELGNVVATFETQLEYVRFLYFISFILYFNLKN